MVVHPSHSLALTCYRTYVLSVQLVESWPPCPRGHPYRADHVVVGWEPCLCTSGHTGHRTYWCREDDVVQLVPACVRGEIGTPEVLGLARPEQKWAD